MATASATGRVPLAHRRLLNSLSQFLRRPASVPLLLALLLILAWIALRLHSPPAAGADDGTSDAAGEGRLHAEANLIRFSAREFPSLVATDSRGWLIDPVAVARHAGILGGAVACYSLHVGQITPGNFRGNHRHHTCNETIVIWGAKTKFRLENASVKDKGYGEVTVAADEVAVAASPVGTAHAMVNVDHDRPSYILGCQDSEISTNSSNSDFRVWKDL